MKWHIKEYTETAIKGRKQRITRRKAPRIRKVVEKESKWQDTGKEKQRRKKMCWNLVEKKKAWKEGVYERAKRKSGREKQE